MASHNLMPWNFFEKENLINEGLNSISLFDPYLWSFVHTQMANKPERKWKSIFASELSVDDLESSLNNLNLFEMDNFVLVHEAEKLSKGLQEWIVENNKMFSGKTYVFIFQSKPVWRKKWFDNGNHLTIDAPKFWQQTETLSLLCKLLKIQMNQAAMRVFIERVPFSWGEYVQSLQDLCENEAAKIEEKDIKEFFHGQKLDKFLLANLIGHKRMKEFWNNLLDLKLNNEELRDVFIFIHAHLFKMINKEEIESKTKTNKYEKEILNAAKKWSKKELLEMLKKVNEWELRLKSQDRFLLPELKLLQMYS